MKKLIAISVVFALAAGSAFAVDLAASVIGTVNVIEANSSPGDVTAGGGMNQLRIHGGGEVADGKFGGYVRLDGLTAPFQSYYAWWKPIDQLKLTIGKFGDGFFEYNGYSCWMFYQSATDTGVTFGGDNSWGGALAVWPNRMRAAFAHGFDEGGLAIEITPVDMVSINIGIPFIEKAGSDIGDIFKSTYAQVALNLSFGTFAFTYAGNASLMDSEIYGYFALKAIDNLEIDFGLGTNFKSDTENDRLNIGLAMKYGADSWGIKFRSLFGIPVKGAQGFGMFFEFLPYFVINESFRVFVAGGVSIKTVDAIAAGAAWFVNPYIEVGEEWGPKFLAGIKVHQTGDLSSSSAPVYFSVPLALIVSF